MSACRSSLTSRPHRVKEDGQSDLGTMSINQCGSSSSSSRSGGRTARSGAFVAQACHADHLTGADALGSAAMPTRPRPRCQLRPQRSLKVAGSTRRSGRQRHRLQPGSSSTATALDAIISGSVLGTVRRRRRPHPVVSQSGKTPHFQKMHANAIILQAPPLPPLGGLPQGGSDAPACGSRGSGLLGRAVCAHQGGIGR